MGGFLVGFREGIDVIEYIDGFIYSEGVTHLTEPVNGLEEIGWL